MLLQQLKQRHTTPTTPQKGVQGGERMGLKARCMAEARWVSAGMVAGLMQMPKSFPTASTGLTVGDGAVAGATAHKAQKARQMVLLQDEGTCSQQSCL